MRIARIRTADRTAIARIESDEALVLTDGSTEPDVDTLRRLLVQGVDLGAEEPSETLALADVELLAPLTAPQKIIAIGLNYADHARESGVEPPAAPVAFAKLPNSIIGPGEPIRFREADSDQVDYEAELAVVIGRGGRDIAEERALEHVFGYTVCNDVSARDAQFADGQWIRGKSYDTFCPLGPWIVTTDELTDPQSLAIRCRVNGETLQDGSTKEMIFGVAQLVSYLSRFLTLEPGDVILTGTPYGVGFARTPQVFLRDGDVVEVEVEGIGTLRNPVVVET